MKTMYDVGTKVYVVDKECSFCIKNVNRCDFCCNKNTCYIIKSYVINKIIAKDKVSYYCVDKDNNGYIFEENNENIFTSPNLARNKLAYLISKSSKK